MSKPEKTFKMGAVRASVFVNTFTNREGQTVPLRKVVLEVRYEDKLGQWQGTNSLSLNDLPKAITALQQAYEYLLSEQGSGSRSSDDASSMPPASASSTAASSTSSASSPSSGSTYPKLIATQRF
jgi:hypothetical protein